MINSDMQIRWQRNLIIITMLKIQIILNEILLLILLEIKISHQSNRIYGGIPAIERKIITPWSSIWNLKIDMEFSFYVKCKIHFQILGHLLFQFKRLNFLIKLNQTGIFLQNVFKPLCIINTMPKFALQNIVLDMTKSR